MNEMTVTGPYKYEGDMHPSFRIDSDERIIACVYASDGDEDAAEELAGHFAATPEAIERAARAMAEAEGWRWDRDSQMLDRCASGFAGTSRERDTWRNRARIALCFRPA